MATSQPILIVDTALQALKPLEAALRSHGYAPNMALDCDDPLAIFSGSDFELVFINLACEGSQALCDSIRANATGSLAPILFVGTGAESVQSPADALSAGGDYFFSLPLDVAKVLAKVQTYLGEGKGAMNKTPPSTADDQLIHAPPPPAHLAPQTADEPDELDDLRRGIPAAPQAPAPRVTMPPPPAAQASQDLADASDAVLAQIVLREAEMAHEAEKRRRADAERKAAEAARRAAEAERIAHAADVTRRDALARQEAQAEAERIAAARVAQEKAEAEIKAHQALLEAEARAKRDMQEQRERQAEQHRIEVEARAQAYAENTARLKAAADVRRAEEEARVRAEEEALAAATAAIATTTHTPPPVEPTVLQPRAPQEAPELAVPAVVPAVVPVPVAAAAAAAASSALAPLAPAQVAENPAVTLGHHKPLDPSTGTLSGNRDIPSLLMDAYEQRITGRLDVTSEQRQKSIFFEDGVPVDGYSSQVYDRMEEYLLRHGKITRSQYQEVRGKRFRSAREAGAYLVNEGFLKTEELFAAVRGQLEELYFGLFEWEEAAYAYRSEVTLETDRVYLKVDPRALIMEGVRRKMGMPRLVRAVGSPTSLVGLRPEGPNIIKALGLLPDELVALRLLDSQRTLEDLVFSSGLDAQQIYQLLYSLVLCGAADIVVRGLDALSNDPRQTDPIDRARILEKSEQVRFLDYFAMLGLSRGATAYEIDKACQEAHEAFDPTRFSSDVRADLDAQLQEIVEILGDAKYVLGDPGRRAAYASHLP